MKKVLIGTNIITLIALLYCCWCCRHPKPTPGVTCYPIDTTAFVGLNKQYAAALVDSYRVRQWTAYNLATGFKDAKADWFSIARLKNFIYEVESKTCKSCLSPKPALGFRFYYGTYPDSSQWTFYGLNGKVDKKYALRHNLLIVPTYYNDSAKMNIDFDPNYMLSGPCRPMPMAQVIANNSAPNTAAKGGPSAGPGIITGSGPVAMMNEGMPWPPPDKVACAGATFGIYLEGYGGGCPW